MSEVTLLENTNINLEIPFHVEDFKKPVSDLLSGISSKLDLDLPDSSIVIQKMKILSENEYKKTASETTDNLIFNSPHERSIGITVLNNFALINQDRAAKIAAEENTTQQEILKLAITHEAIHLTETNDLIKNKNDLTSFLTSRYGLLLNRDDKDDLIAIGSRQLEEGAAEFIREQILASTGATVITRYPDELKLIKELAAKIGDLPFYEALYLPEGISLLNLALEKVYGENMLRILISHVATDYRKRTSVIRDQDRTDYLSTQALLERRKNTATDGI